RPPKACASALQKTSAAPKPSATIARLFIFNSSKNTGEGNTTRVLSPQDPKTESNALPAGLSRQSDWLLVEVGVASTPFTHLVLSSPQPENLRQPALASYFS